VAIWPSPLEALVSMSTTTNWANFGHFWRNKKVFVTGHTGFKGGWLAMWLTMMGAKVTGFSLPPNTNPSLYAKARIDKLIEQSQLGDIRDYEKLKLALVESEPEVVFHLAAQPLVRYSYQNPLETYQTNVMGTAHLLEAMRYIDSVRAAVIITTDKCYENTEKLTAYAETDPMGGYDPYSSSKGCTELVVSAYQRSFFSKEKYTTHRLAIATARAGNVIGGGDWSQDRLIPDALKAFEAEKTLSIRNPAAVRPWQHVLDPLAGYLVLGQRLFESGPLFIGAWNFGPHTEDEKPVSAVIDTLAQILGPTARWERDGTTHPHEASVLRLDFTKAREQLGWQPRWPLNVALNKTVAWHQAVKANQNMHEFSLTQIAEYSVS
jgi:CDP-glucose 4,6-dehydratase